MSDIMIQAPRAVVFAFAGGEGIAYGGRLMERLARRREVEAIFIDTKAPADIPSTAFVQVDVAGLPDPPTGIVAEVLAMTGVAPGRYSRLLRLVGGDGASRMPFLAFLAVAYRAAELRRCIEEKIRAVSSRIGGAAATDLITIASAGGGTGTAACRVAGWACRVASEGGATATNARWVHVMLLGSLLPSDARSRRTAALEHRQLVEFRELMRPGASLCVPGLSRRIASPGPDELIVQASSPEHPRTPGDAAEELGVLVENWIAGENGR